jgi:plastocyanin
MTSSVSVAIMIAILVVAALASYLAFSQGTTGPSTTTTTPDVTTAFPITGSGSSVTSSTTSSDTSSTSSSSSSAADSTMTSSSTTTTTSSDQTSPASLNSSQVLVIIPPGIEKLSNKISFEPINVTVVIGVNNTIVFVNNDDQEHILESTSWPQTGQPFQLYSLPGSMVNVTLTTPGTYTYFCEWHPIWMDGTITVVAR